MDNKYSTKPVIWLDRTWCSIYKKQDYTLKIKSQSGDVITNFGLQQPETAIKHWKKIITATETFPKEITCSGYVVTTPLGGTWMFGVNLLEERGQITCGETSSYVQFFGKSYITALHNAIQELLKYLEEDSKIQ